MTHYECRRIHFTGLRPGFAAALKVQRARQSNISVDVNLSPDHFTVFSAMTNHGVSPKMRRLLRQSSFLVDTPDDGTVWETRVKKETKATNGVATMYTSSVVKFGVTPTRLDRDQERDDNNYPPRAPLQVGKA